MSSFKFHSTNPILSLLEENIAIGQDEKTKIEFGEHNEIHFHTNNTERMQIDSSGNVGIGTDDPQTLLHIEKANDPKIRVMGVAPDTTAGIQLFESNSTHYGAELLYDGSESKVHLGSYNGIQTLRKDFTIDRVTGNVGIGTTIPHTALEVKGENDPRIRVMGGAPDTTAGIQLFESNSAQYGVELLYDGSESKFHVGSDNGPDTNGIQTLRKDFTIDRVTGNVGIGTTIPHTALEVKGENDPRIRVMGGAPDTTAGIQLFESNSAQYGVELLYDGSENKFHLGSYNEGGIRKDFTINRVTGNVGIGNDDPQTALGVQGDVSCDNSKVGINNTSQHMGAVLSVRQLLHSYATTGAAVDGSHALSMEDINRANIWSFKIGLDSPHLSVLYNGILKGYISETYTTFYPIQMNFTGQHRCILNTNLDGTSKGLIVSSSGKYINLDNSLHANINESLPICTITNIDNGIEVFGVISDKEDTNDNRTYDAGSFVTPYEKTNKNEQRMFINSLGEGAVWVCNKNDVLVNGDYISSSSVPGYGMRQTLNQNILANHTVAKITCDCDFSLTKIVKQKLKVTTTTETYETSLTQDVEKIKTETKTEYDTTLSRYVQKEVTTTTTEREQLYDTVDLYNESGEIVGTHRLERKETKTKTISNMDYDDNGDVQYEDDLDADGNQQMIYPFETRFLQEDATQITEMEYNTKLAAGESVYFACFVGCTYHCG